LIFAGAILIANGWKAIHETKDRLVTAGPYGYVRHPQYIGFIAVIVGFLIQWPTLVTLAMAPVLIIRYLLLAKKEEQNMLKQYPKEYGAYMQKIPAWIPKMI
jgi:protein-S-isoprenylcysteine O-methyltransferase Ste14